MNETQVILVKSALAALTQNATYPSDVDFARDRLREALAAQQPFALDGACAECGGGYLHKEGCSRELAFFESPRSEPDACPACRGKRYVKIGMYHEVCEVCNGTGKRR